MLNPHPGTALERLRELALALPDASEKVSHGMPAFQAGGRMFAYFKNNHHGDGRTDVCLKTTGREEQDMLIEADPDLYAWPAYLGASGWISLSLAGPEIDWAHVEGRLRGSHALAAPARRRTR